MNVSLVYAGIAGKGFDSIGQGMDSGWISHGLAMLSAVLQGPRLRGRPDRPARAARAGTTFREELLQRRPGVCGLTMMSVDFNPVMQCCRRHQGNRPLHHRRGRRTAPTLMTEEVLANPKIDYVVTRGGGRSRSRGCWPAIERGQPPMERLIAGEMPDLDALPYSDHDLFLTNGGSGATG